MNIIKINFNFFLIHNKGCQTTEKLIVIIWKYHNTFFTQIYFLFKSKGWVENFISTQYLSSILFPIIISLSIRVILAKTLTWGIWYFKITANRTRKVPTINAQSFIYELVIFFTHFTKNYYFAYSNLRKWMWSVSDWIVFQV